MKLNSKGFSLVELMVVVAIIGILASVAVPSINKYMAKARQSEAKTNLGSLYTAEKAFAAEYTQYHTAFQAIGFSPEGRLRYNVGFSGAGVVAGAADGYTQPATVDGTLFSALLYCNGVGNLGGSGRAACLMLNGADGAAPAAVVAATTAAGPIFTAGAHAVLVTGTTDVWQINNSKVLINSTNGVL